MIAVLLLQLVRHPAWLLVAALAATFALCGIQASRAAHLKAELRSARVALRDPRSGQLWEVEAAKGQRTIAALKEQDLRLTSALTDQNAAVERFRVESQMATERAAIAVRAAMQARLRAGALAIRVMQAEPSEDVCQGADKLILESLGGGTR
jgi:hypothetical protein